MDPITRLDPQTQRLLDAYNTKNGISSGGGDEVVSHVLKSLGVNALSGIKGISTLPQGADAATKAIEDYQSKYGPSMDLSPAGQEYVRNTVAPLYSAIGNSGVGRAMHGASQDYGEGAQHLSDLVGKYLGPSAAGAIGATADVAPYLIQPEALAGAAMSAKVVPRMLSDEVPRVLQDGSTIAGLMREGVAAKRSAPPAYTKATIPTSQLDPSLHPPSFTPPDGATSVVAMDPETGEQVAHVTSVRRGDGVQNIRMDTLPGWRGYGIAPDLLSDAVSDAHSQGVPYRSDTQLSVPAAKAFEKIPGAVRNEDVTHAVDPHDGDVGISNNGRPVYEIPAAVPSDDAEVGEAPRFDPSQSWIGRQAMAEGGEAAPVLGDIASLVAKYSKPLKEIPASGYQAPQELEDFVRSNAPAHRVDPNGPASWEELQASRHEPVMPINPQSAENSIYSDTPTNIAFRAWHDKLHLDLNAGFDHDGELKVAQEHLRQAQAAGLSEEAQRALWADTWETFKHHEDTGDFPSNPRMFVAQQMQNQFPGDGSMLNIGLNQGQDGQAGFRTMSAPEAQNAIESTGAKVTKASVLTPGQHSVSEPTLVASTDRPLDEPEMQSILAQTKQSAIPQRTNAGATSMHIAPGHEQIAKEQGWDQFNPDYFHEHDGSTAPPVDPDAQPPGMADGGEVEPAIGDIGALVAKYAGEQAPNDHAAQLAAHVADNGGVTYNPTTGDVHSHGFAVPTEPSRSQVFDAPPSASDLHDFMMHNQDAFAADPKAALHVESDDDGYHIAHIAHIEPDPQSATLAADSYSAPGFRDLSTGTNHPTSGTSRIGSSEADPDVEQYLEKSRVPAANMPADIDPELNQRPQAPWTHGQPTVANPQRVAFPGIYNDPRQVIADANAMVGPEDPLLQQLFGVSRQDLSDLSTSRQGNELGTLPGAKQNPQGAKSALAVMTPQNEQRLIDVLTEARGTPLHTGMTGWYSMDPLYKRFEEIFGPEEAPDRYQRFNALMGMASPGSDVGTEIARGTSAHWLNNEGRFNDFLKYAGLPGGERSSMPEDMLGIPGHPYHRTAQGQPMADYLRTGEIQMQSPKVPMYISASGVPQIGFQSDLPVGDAHWARGVGLADTRNPRTSKGVPVVPGSSVSTPEMQTLAPWWRDRVAAQAGYQSVPAQATAWGAFAPATGVESQIGAPKLEILATQIGKLADRLGVSPETARDLVIQGKAGAY